MYVEAFDLQNRLNPPACDESLSKEEKGGKFFQTPQCLGAPLSLNNIKCTRRRPIKCPARMFTSGSVVALDGPDGY